MRDGTGARAVGEWRASQRSSAFHATVTPGRVTRPRVSNRRATHAGRVSRRAATPGRAGWLGVAGLVNLAVRSPGRTYGPATGTCPDGAV